MLAIGVTNFPNKKSAVTRLVLGRRTAINAGNGQVPAHGRASAMKCQRDLQRAQFNVVGHWGLGVLEGLLERLLET